MAHPEQVYPDVNHIMFESLLRAKASRRESKVICVWAIRLLRQSTIDADHRACLASAPLFVLRFGDGRSARHLRTCLEYRLDVLPMEVIRACSAVYISYGGAEFECVRRAAARSLHNPMGDLIKVVERIRGYTKIPERLAPRLEPRFDALTRKFYVDIRALLQFRLLTLNRKPQIRQWLNQKKQNMLKSELSTYDKKLIRRLLRA
jgi:hypothetical protein